MHLTHTRTSEWTQGMPGIQRQCKHHTRHKLWATYLNTTQTVGSKRRYKCLLFVPRAPQCVGDVVCGVYTGGLTPAQLQTLQLKHRERGSERPANTTYRCLNHLGPLLPQISYDSRDVHFPLLLHCLEGLVYSDECSCPANSSTVRRGERGESVCVVQKERS